MSPFLHDKILQSETMKKLAPFSWWVQAACVPIGSNDAIKMLQDIDSVCLELEKNNKNLDELAKKIQPFTNQDAKSYYINECESYVSIKDLNKTEQERRRQIWDFINELRACMWLLKNNFVDVEFIPRNKTKTPDIITKKDQQIWFIEVKTLHTPREEEIRLLQKNVTIRDVDRNYFPPLKSKIEYFINDSNSKFNCVKASNRLVIIFTTFSISALLQNKEASLNHVLEKIPYDGMTIISIDD